MDVLSPAIVILVGVIAAVVATQGLGRREQQYAMLAFAAHIVCSFAQWAIVQYYYGASDFDVYQSEGAQLARLMDLDFPHFAPEVAKLALHMNTSLPFQAFGDGGSTGTMSALAGFAALIVGSSSLALYLVTSWFSWIGLLCWYRVAREELEPADLGPAAVGLLGVPSVLFWSSGFIKEAFVVGFFGLLGLSTYRLLKNRAFGRIFGAVVGATGVAMLKSYTLFAYVLAVAVFIYVDRASREGRGISIRPAYLALAGAIAVGGVVAMGAIFPDYSAGQLAETASQNQEAFQGYGEAGSHIEVGNSGAKTIPEQIRFIPVALVNSFFRPAVFEARNGPMLGAAIENTLLMLALLSLLGASARSVVRKTLLSTPFLLSSIAFVLVFGIGIGLATGNLGSLSRYRMPMMPFYVTAVLVLRRRAGDARRAETERPSRVLASR